MRHFDENGEIVTTFPQPVGHYQIDGDYHASWQPAEISKKAKREVYRIAKRIADVLGGLFGVEMFVEGDKVWPTTRLLEVWPPSEGSSWPPDTGRMGQWMWTLSDAHASSDPPRRSVGVALAWDRDVQEAKRRTERSPTWWN